LLAADESYFLREYTSGKIYKFGETSNLISNLKKKPSQSGTRGCRCKTSAIEQCAREISAAGRRLEWLRIGTLVPVSPKARGHPDHDDSIARLCRAIRTALLCFLSQTLRTANAVCADVETNSAVANAIIGNRIAHPTPWIGEFARDGSGSQWQPCAFA
jgi:hypothetical protein